MEFSIELQAEQIYDARTRDAFEEVLRCYAGSNFRSAVVMLWSVAICDLLYKLEALESLYGDRVARAILQRVETAQTNNPTSPEWEPRLVDDIAAQTQLLEAADRANLRALQDHRHLSAHPVRTRSAHLFAPPREVVRAHIRNALEGVLTKPPILSRRVFDTLVEDIEANKGLLLDEVSLRRYLDAKFLRGLRPNIETVIFRDLWKLVFRLTEQRCEDNRDINYRTLAIFYERRPRDLMEAIAADPDYFSQVTTAGSTLEALKTFFQKYPRPFALLSDAAKVPVRTDATRTVGRHMVSWFLSGTVEDHIEDVARHIQNRGRSHVSPEEFNRFYKFCRDNERREDARTIVVDLLQRSLNFAMADEIMVLIVPILEDFEVPELEALVRVIDANDQVYRRSEFNANSRAQLGAIQEVLARKSNGIFDFTPFGHFTANA